jgi:hypothetical protein
VTAQPALITDLPPEYLKRAHWLRAGKALVTAAETGKSRDIEYAFEAIVAALDEEGWLPQGVSRAPCSERPRAEPPRSERPRFFEPRRLKPLRFFEPPRGNITSKQPAEPLWRRIHPTGRH